MAWTGTSENLITVAFIMNDIARSTQCRCVNVWAVVSRLLLSCNIVRSSLGLITTMVNRGWEMIRMRVRESTKEEFGKGREDEGSDALVRFAIPSQRTWTRGDTRVFPKICLPSWWSILIVTKSEEAQCSRCTFTTQEGKGCFHLNKQMKLVRNMDAGLTTAYLDAYVDVLHNQEKKKKVENVDCHFSFAIMLTSIAKKFFS